MLSVERPALPFMGTAQPCTVCWPRWNRMHCPGSNVCGGSRWQAGMQAGRQAAGRQQQAAAQAAAGRQQQQRQQHVHNTACGYNVTGRGSQANRAARATDCPARPVTGACAVLSRCAAVGTAAAVSLFVLFHYFSAHSQLHFAPVLSCLAGCTAVQPTSAGCFESCADVHHCCELG